MCSQIEAVCFYCIVKPCRRQIMLPPAGFLEPGCLLSSVELLARREESCLPSFGTKSEQDICFKAIEVRTKLEEAALSES